MVPVHGWRNVGILGHRCQAASLCRHTLVPLKIALQRWGGGTEGLVVFNSSQSGSPGGFTTQDRCQELPTREMGGGGLGCKEIWVWRTSTDINSALDQLHSCKVCVYGYDCVWTPYSSVCKSKGSWDKWKGVYTTKLYVKLIHQAFVWHVIGKKAVCMHIERSSHTIHTHTPTHTLPFLSNPHKWQWMAECKWAGYYTATFIKLSWKDFNGPDEYACKFVN